MAAFHEKVVFMKNETTSTPSVPAAQIATPALFSTMPDWRSNFRLGALDLNPDLADADSHQTRSASGEANEQQHWIMNDPVLARMVMSLIDDAQSLSAWRDLGGKRSAPVAGLAIIREMGFADEREPAGILGCASFMARFTWACLRFSRSMTRETSIVMHSYRRRVA